MRQYEASSQLLQTTNRCPQTLSLARWSTSESQSGALHFHFILTLCAKGTTSSLIFKFVFDLYFIFHAKVLAITNPKKSFSAPHHRFWMFHCTVRNGILPADLPSDGVLMMVFLDI